MALSLANFSVTPDTAVILAQLRLTSALVRRTPTSNQYNFWSGDLWAANNPGNPNTNNIEEGDWTFENISGAPPIISRFFKVVATGDNRFAWNFDGSSGRTDLWNSTTDPYRVTLVHETSSGTIQMFTLEPVPLSNGTGFLAWRTAPGAGSRPLTDAEWAIVDSIADGDSVIVAFHQGTASYATPSTDTRMVYLGATALDAVYLGDAEVAVYLGDTLIHSR